ncbi:hypothetical protein BRD03_13715 [Halobacteriales archaeon QS_9_68_17]|nr:MAG: hypothetical protein BRD03_13715 [Halobacteriales archaeon QS_9_68_17]
MMFDGDRTSGYDSVVSRRRFLAATGAAGATAIAGCSDDAQTGGEGDEDTDGDVVDRADAWFATAQVEHQVQQFQYNQNVWGGSTHASFGLFSEYTQYLIGEDEFHPHFVEDWEVGDTTMTLQLRDDFTWGNGDDITADDVVMQLEIQEYLGESLWDFAEDATAVDDTTVEISYPEGTNLDIIQHSVLHNTLDHPPADFSDAHEAIRNGEDADLFFEIEEPTPSGPIGLADTSSSYHEYEIRDDHPLAGNYNWNGYRMGYRDSNTSAHQSFAAGELDGIHSLFADPGTMEQFSDSLEEIQIPGMFGFAIVFNHADEHYGERAVRKAFMYAIDESQVIDNVGASTKIDFDAPVGLTAAGIDSWLGDSIDEYESYDRDLDRVEELLTDAGFERNDDDVWERDGQTLEAPVIAPASWSDWALTASTIVDQLSQAGFDASEDMREGGAWGEAAANGDFKVIAEEHTEGGDPANNYPFFSLRYKFLNDKHGDESYFNYPEEVTVPARDGDGEVTVDFRDTFEEFATTNDEDRIQELVEQLAWVFNQDLPLGMVQEKQEQSFLSRHGWEFPDQSEHFQTFWPMWWLPKVDELKATSNAE